MLSLGNPWLDFLEPAEAAPLAEALNKDLQEYCNQHNEFFYGFGVLPTSSPKDCVLELRRIAGLDKMRGAIVCLLLFADLNCSLDWHSWLWKGIG